MAVAKPMKNWMAVIPAGMVQELSLASEREDEFREKWLYTNSHTHRWVGWAIEQVAPLFIAWATKSDKIAAQIVNSSHFAGVYFRAPLTGLGRGKSDEQRLTHYLKYLVLQVSVPPEVKGGRTMFYSPQKGEWDKQNDALRWKEIAG